MGHRAWGLGRGIKIVLAILPKAVSIVVPDKLLTLNMGMELGA